MRRLCLAFALLLSLAAATAAGASAAAGTALVAARAPHPLALDPALSDPAWQAGRIDAGSFWNVTTRARAELDTIVYLLYDDRNLYVAFHADQARVPIAATQTVNNVGFGIDDFVGIALDTSGAGNLVYFFETTPRGIRYQQASENARYDARWQSAGQPAALGWNAVLIVPIAAMRLPGGSHQTWRINFIRNVAARGEHYSWAFDGLMTDGPIVTAWPAFADARFWPRLTLDGIVPVATSSRSRPHADVYALASGGTDRALFQQADGTFRRQNVRPAGADVTLPLTGTINAVGTIDPDFSNVEVDQQTIAPQEFQRQLNEYRPFFAQGARFLDPSSVAFSSPTSPNNKVFSSPRIGPFDRGIKLEGSFGLQSFGALAFRAFDQTTGDTIDDITYGYKHALPDRTFSYWADGVVAHHSRAGDDTTSDFGALGQNAKSGFLWGTSEAFEHGSWVPTTGVAHSGTAFISVQKPNWQIAAGYNDLSPNYNPIDGLTFNSDIHGFQGFAQTSGATRTAKNYTLLLNVDRWFDRSGAVHESDVMAGLAVAFRNGLSITNLGPSLGTLRSYDVPAEGGNCGGAVAGRSFFTGFPCYRNGRDERFDLFQVALGYKDGTPTPIDASVSFGPFGANDTQLYTFTASRPLGRLSLGLEYDGTLERSLTTGVRDSQWLRRLSLGAPLGTESNVSVSLRSISGLGGFAREAGTNLALAYHRRFRNGDDVFVDYGTPAAFSTLHRVILKYVLHVNADAGT